MAKEKGGKDSYVPICLPRQMAAQNYLQLHCYL